MVESTEKRIRNVLRMMETKQSFGAPSLWGGPAFVACTLAIMPVFIAVIMSLFVLVDGNLVYTGDEAYVRLFQSPHIESMANIVARGALVASICQLFAIPAGYFLVTRNSATVRILLVILVLVPFFTSDAIRAFGWSRILAEDSLFCIVLAKLSSGYIGSEGLRFTETAVVIALSSAVLPFGVLAIASSLPRAGDDVWKASVDLGASRAWSFLHLVLPTAMPGVMIGWLFQALLATFSSVEEQYVGNSTSMHKLASDLINTDIGDSSSRFFALTASILVLLVGVIVLIGLVVVLRHRIASGFARLVIAATELLGVLTSTNRGRRDSESALSNRWSANRGFMGIASLVAIIVYVVVLAPLVPIVLLSFSKDSEAGSGLTFDHFAGLLSATSLKEALTRSILVAVIVGGLCSITASLLATIWWHSTRIRYLLFLIISLGALMPADSYSYAMLRLVSTLGIKSGGAWLATIGHFVWALPFCVCTLALAYSRLNVTLLQAGMEFGLSRFALWRHLIVRLTLAAFLAALLFGLLLSLNEFTRGVYLGGSEEFLSRTVYGRLESGLVGTGRRIFALGTVLIIFSSVLAGLSFVGVVRLIRRKLGSTDTLGF